METPKKPTQEEFDKAGEEVEKQLDLTVTHDDVAKGRLEKPPQRNLDQGP